MKSKSAVYFTLIVILVLGIAAIGIFGMQLGDKKIPKAKDAINLGLDLQGGVYVLLQAETDATGQELARYMEQAKTIIQQRVDGLGVSEPNIAIEGSNRIRVELAGLNDLEEALQLIGKTAQLEFVDPDGNVVLTGKNVDESIVQYVNDPIKGNEPVIALEFDKEGAEKFAEATKRLAAESDPQKKILFIRLDNEVISAPIVNEEIRGGKAIINGGTEPMKLEDATRTAALIKAGALPVPMKELTSSVIGPTLGLDAYERSVLAIGISIVLIMVILLVLYKALAIPACISLIAYTEINIALFLLLGVKLSLPGIAGLLLSIGMAVDANVIIFERIREEILAGKTHKAAIRAGYKNALSSIIDSNITTLIAGIVLYVYGIGAIRGFGVTLIIGIVASMFTAVVLTRWLLNLMVGFKDFKSKKAFGA
ncbi:MAG: protein translocase subunit SecD [Ezakiella sp.]|nr:protein translocase subunit SecD [Ezakiella sp.]MDD7471934.1 protein translocase subunit SecD [Bacillota bacterium]MDY3923898.1 protein translocase subunit SecD [Ezakiella sp.]